MQSNDELNSYIENVSLFLLGALLLVFPLFFLTITTDTFVLPKEMILGGVVVICLILGAVKIALNRQVIIRRTPFDLPIVLFAIAALLSAILAVNRTDSLISFVTLILGLVLYFIIVNVARDKKSILLLTTSLVTGAGILSIVSLLTFLKIYILPFPFTHSQIFSPLGSLLDQALYLLLILPVAIYFARPSLSSIRKSPAAEQSAMVNYENAGESKKQNRSTAIAFAVLSVLILLSFLFTVYKLLSSSPQNGGLIVLPFTVGFQTALAAISQDTGRVLQGFLFGSGFGTYVTDFTKFKPATFNLSQDIWTLTFFRSSSFMLELLATTGVLGTLAFLYLILRILKEQRIFALLVIAIVASFIMPFSFTIQIMFFILLALLAVGEGTQPHSHTKVFDIELQLVALKKGLIAFDTSPSKERSAVLPSISTIIILFLAGLISYFGFRYTMSDIIFQQSLVAASQNNGSLTYTTQLSAISMFPYRDAYYRIFSQTNLALANSIASSQPKDASPSAQTQQTIFTLIQQSINSGRTATTYGPLTMLNWQNLASVYRSLIGFGQNADSFAILATQQAITLDPNNPMEYINLGGIYYQLGQWDNAIRQFQIAAALKPDYANAYYNLGHALQEKGNLDDALSQYQVVQRLVASDPANSKKIKEEIDILQKKGVPTASTGQTENGLNVNSPSSKLPPQNPPVKIPPPIEATRSSRR